jgi:hypothetical protein
MIFNILLVRHGVSCSQALNYEEGNKGKEILDPKITDYGIFLSSVRSWDLREIVKKIFKKDNGHEPLGISSSIMLRAKMTAWYMCLNNKEFAGKTLYILPYIGEEAKNKVDTLENTFSSHLEQISNFPILSEMPITDITVEKGIDTTKPNRQNIDKFLEMLRNYQSKDGGFFKKGSDNIWRGIIFTHHNFIRNLSLKFRETIEVNNNDVVLFKYDTTTPDTAKFHLITMYGLGPEKRVICTTKEEPETETERQRKMQEETEAQKKESVEEKDMEDEVSAPALEQAGDDLIEKKDKGGKKQNRKHHGNNSHKKRLNNHRNTIWKIL